MGFWVWFCELGLCIKIHVPTRKLLFLFTTGALAPAIDFLLVIAESSPSRRLGPLFFFFSPPKNI